MKIFKNLGAASLACLAVLAFSRPGAAQTGTDFTPFVYLSISSVGEFYDGIPKKNTVVIRGQSPVGVRQLTINGIDTTADPNPNETAKACVQFARQVMEAPSKFRMQVFGRGDVDTSGESLGVDLAKEHLVGCTLVPAH